MIMGDPKSKWDRIDLEESISKGGDTSTIQGDFAPVARKIPIPDLVHSTRLRLTVALGSVLAASPLRSI